MPSAAYDILQRPRLTVAEYYCMAEVGILSQDAHVELIEGEVIDIPPIESPHASAVFFTSDRLHDAVKGMAFVRVQNPIRLSQYSELRPDVALLRPRP